MGFMDSKNFMVVLEREERCILKLVFLANFLCGRFKKGLK